MITTLRRTRTSSIGFFMLVWFGQVLSFIGSGLTSFALGLHVYRTTGSITLFALIPLFTVLPGVILGPLAGAIIDRWDRRRVMILSDIGGGGTRRINTILGRSRFWDKVPLNSRNSGYNSENHGRFFKNGAIIEDILAATAAELND